MRFPHCLTSLAGSWQARWFRSPVIQILGSKPETGYGPIPFLSDFCHICCVFKLLTGLSIQVLVISTDYRDLRKAAYQEYVVAFDYNTVRLPPSMSSEEGATLGVAFVAAALALGVCMGVDFSSVLDGPDLFSLVRQVAPELLPEDVRQECLDGILGHERAAPGDWLAIWGGKSTPSFSFTSPSSS